MPVSQPVCARHPIFQSFLIQTQDGQAKRVARRGEQHRPQADPRARATFEQTGLRHGLPALRHVSDMNGVNAGGGSHSQRVQSVEKWGASASLLSALSHF